MTTSPCCQLHTKLMPVAPVVSVSIPDPVDRTTWIIQYDVSATAAQITSAQNIISTFDPTAEDTRLATFANDPNFISMRSQLKSATAAQIISYVDAQVPELSVNARTILKKILLLLAVVV